ncbi:hypothetical protein ARAM_001820 [Aspergillus rambellii]|uniref:Uncharacterized protein n=1 Tax=Aspergillus rambellii TaxID=308745 RepID=A0A0F8UCF0_9EURO|nr:hypothetical protein ARAM_001820 [Aspergillus rambellii]
MARDDASPQAYDPPEPSGSSPAPSASAIAKYPGLQIKPDLITHPDLFTLYFGFFGPWFWKRKFTASLSQRIENARVLVQRPPTQEELDAFVTHTSRGVYQQRMGAPLGLLGGTARLLAQARKSAHFATYMPRAAADKKTAPPTPANLVDAARAFARADPALFKQAAKMSALRLFFWTLAGASVSSVYAVWVDWNSTLTDPRLRQFVEDVKHQNPDDVRKRRAEATAERVKGRSRQGQQQQQQQPEELGFEEFEARSGMQGLESGSEPVVQETGQVQEQNRFARAALYSQYSQRDSRQPHEEQNRAVGFFDDDDDDDDDASPTAPEYRETVRKEFGGAQGSAWDRIRQQNQTQAQAAGPGMLKPSRPLQPKSDSWGSGASGDGQQEREQAQAEFDRLVDAERNLPGESTDTF